MVYTIIDAFSNNIIKGGAMENNYFSWDKEFITGLETVDAQHFGLVEIINDLLKLSLKSELVDIESIDDISERLTEYVVDHFKTEDALMTTYGVDPRHIKLHHKLHGEFVKNVTYYFNDKEALKVPDKLGEVSEFLVRWLAYHILNTDKSMVRQIELIEKEGLSGSDAYDQESHMVDMTTEPLLKALKALFFLVSEKNRELENKVKERTAALEEANRRLEELSMNDELTKLPNRRYIMGEIERLIMQFERYNTTFSLLFIDLNKFKSVNDTYGHDAGDQVLRWVANFMKEHIRKTDIPCRLGGDEFVIVCPHLDGPSALKLAHKLCEAIQTEKRLEYWIPSFSIGVAEIESSVHSASEMLLKADGAMYEIKKSGSCGAYLVENIEQNV